MASEYSVNIKLNTAQVKKDLRTIGTEISNLGKKEAKSSKTALSASEKRVKTETQIANLQKRTQSLRNSALRLELKGLNVSKANNKIKLADKNLENRKINLTQKNIALAAKELEILKQQTVEVSKQTKARNTFRFPMGPSSPLNFGPGGQLLPGSGTGMFGTTRGFDVGSALISGGFPLLFGQGPVTAAAGAIGGGVGGMFGQMGGFAGGIAATTAVQTLSNFTKSIEELGNALSRPTENIGTLVDKLGLANDPTGRLALKLEKLGLTSSASALLMEEFTKQTGKSPDMLKNAAEEINEMNKSLAIFSLKLQLLGAEVLLPIIDALNKIPFGSMGKRIKPITNLLMFGQFEDPSETVNRMKGISNIPASEGNAVIGGVPLNPDFGKTPGQIKTASSLGNLAKDMEFNKEIKPLQQALEIETKRLTMSSEKLNLMKEQFELDNLTSELDILRLENQQQSTDQLVSQITKLENQVALQEQVVANAEALIDPARQVAQIFAQDMGNAIKGLIQGTQTLNQALSNVLNKLADAVLNMTLFGNIGGSFQKDGGLLGGIFGGLFANGGRPPVGKLSVVGEKGPELFVPDRAGTIVPNNELGGMGGSTNIVVNVDASGSEVEGDEDEGRQLGTLIAAAVQGELIKQQRPGGLLSR